MRRLALVALAPLLLTGCGSAPPPLPPAQAAPPQRAELGWTETIGDAGARFTFRVRSFQVLEDGWQARVSVTNGTGSAFDAGAPGDLPSRTFGVMLFETGNKEELDRRNHDGTLPAIRHAQRFEPELPKTLAPGQTWSGTISSAGPLAAGVWVRLVFGDFRPSAGNSVPASLRKLGVDRDLIWITDHAYRLRAPTS